MSILQSFIEVYESKQEDEMSLEKYLKICKKDKMAYATAAERREAS
jgi:serine protein kinase